MFITRRGAILAVLFSIAACAGRAAIQVKPDPARAIVPFLGWDSEDGPRANTNLLRVGTGLRLRVKMKGQWRAGEDVPTQCAEGSRHTTQYRLLLPSGAEPLWSLQSTGEKLTQTISVRGPQWQGVEAVEMIFPFDPRVTPTTVLPKAWSPDGHLLLPAIISAPDFGQWLLTCKGNPDVKGRLEGSRAKHTVDLIVELPQLRENQLCVLSLTPVRLPAPRGLKDQSLWQIARRGWFNALQCTAQWGDAGNPFSAPAGVLANNVISDPASCSLWFYADQAFWTPDLAPQVSAMALVRHTLDWWLDEKVLPTGEVICYWDKAHFLDANAGPLIAAWDYVEATGDKAWLGAPDPTPGIHC